MPQNIERNFLSISVCENCSILEIQDSSLDILCVHKIPETEVKGGNATITESSQMVNHE